MAQLFLVQWHLHWWQHAGIAFHLQFNQGWIEKRVNKKPKGKVVLGNIY